MSEIHNEINVIRQTLINKSNLIIFDVGGCDFNDACFFKNYFPNSQVFSFEPDEFNLKTYKSRADQNGVIVVPVALSDSNDEVDFYPSISYNGNTHKASGSTLKPNVKPGTSEGVNHDGLLYDLNGYKIQIVRLDTFCELNNINHVDYLHIDVQGAEKKVLNGIGNIRPSFIFAETCEFTTYDSGHSKEDFDKFMDELGYEIIHEFRDDTLYKHKNDFVGFVSPKWLDKL
jgi:FkbM family methyltransferase